MTTPEALKGRQLRILHEVRIGLVILIVMAGATAWGYYSSQREDNEQRDCIARNFTELTDALNARSDIVTRNTQSVNKVILAVATAKEPEQFRAALDTFVEEQAVIEADRKKPLSEYPEGDCS